MDMGHDHQHKYAHEMDHGQGYSHEQAQEQECPGYVAIEVQLGDLSDRVESIYLAVDARLHQTIQMMQQGLTSISDLSDLVIALEGRFPPLPL